MQPILFKLGPLTLYSYGVFVALAFLVGGLVAYRLAKRNGLSTGNLLDYFLYAALAGLLGARLWHVLWKPSQVDSFFELFLLSGAGLSLFGGLLLAGLVLFLLLRRQRQPIARWFDVFAVSVMAGLAVGKVGSFLNGDSFGRSSTMPWAVQFNDPQAPAYIMGVELHPLQLYAAMAYAAVAVLLWRLGKRSAPKATPSHPPGYVGWVGACSLAVIIFVLEFFHAPIDSLYAAGSVNVVTWSAVLLTVVSGGVLVSRYRVSLNRLAPRRR